MAGHLDDGADDLVETHEINVTPFIDVMLVLLIIFMVAAPLSTVDVHVDLPVSTAANLTADFAGAARIGDWVEAHVDVQKIGGRLAFANAFLVVDGERIVRASAVFTRAGPLADPQS